jgi:MerR family mercuric resistance operon transcriptional regulator
MDTFTTGQLAKKANVNPETIRFYERRGLLPEPPRNKSGHRQYSIKDLRRTEFIKRTQSLGFSLQEISDLLSLSVESGKTCRDVKHSVKAKLIDIEAKIETLESMKAVLQRLETDCPGMFIVSGDH